MKDKMERFGGADKPAPKRKRGSQDRFAFHQCFHGDALLGVALLDDGERGVYITIIWTMYQQRSALPLDYAWLARINNISVQRLRARLKALADKGRLIVDEEAGLVFDERSMRELVAAERYNQAQTDRAKTRWQEKGGGGKDPKPKPELRVVPPAALAELGAVLENVSGAEQIQPPPQPRAQPRAQPPENHGRRKASYEENQGPGECRAHANHIHNHNTPQTPQDQAQPASPGADDAQPPRGGVVLPSEVQKRRAAALAALDQLKAGAAEPAQGLEGDRSEGDQPGSIGGDRKAVRS